MRLRVLPIELAEANTCQLLLGTGIITLCKDTDSVSVSWMTTGVIHGAVVVGRPVARALDLQCYCRGHSALSLTARLMPGSMLYASSS